jgi:hypothetical protein
MPSLKEKLASIEELHLSPPISDAEKEIAALIDAIKAFKRAEDARNESSNHAIQEGLVEKQNKLAFARQTEDDICDLSSTSQPVSRKAEGSFNLDFATDVISIPCNSASQELPQQTGSYKSRLCQPNSITETISCSTSQELPQEDSFKSSRIDLPTKFYNDPRPKEARPHFANAPDYKRTEDKFTRDNSLRDLLANHAKLLDDLQARLIALKKDLYKLSNGLERLKEDLTKTKDLLQKSCGGSSAIQKSYDAGMQPSLIPEHRIEYATHSPGISYATSIRKTPDPYTLTEEYSSQVKVKITNCQTGVTSWQEAQECYISSTVCNDNYWQGTQECYTYTCSTDSHWPV